MQGAALRPRPRQLAVKKTSLLATAVVLAVVAPASWSDVSPADVARAGADWWSLQPVRRPALPKVNTAAWVRSPIDVFILARLEAAGLKPTPPAGRALLLRRATFDLHGLPPTPEAIDAFVSDTRPDAWARVVDRLLASPHYGEHWGRHWLDVARFSESHGFEYDKIRDNAWRYRDYVIKSFNDDKPYPQFVREQLAGDAITPVTIDGINATGFLVSGPWDEAGNGSASALVKARAREEEMEDMLAVVGQGLLGLTVNCARCHDHKFDPIEQADYYRFKDAFTGVRAGNRVLLTPEQALARNEAIASLADQIDKVEQKRAAVEQAGRAKLATASESVAPPAPVSRWTFKDGTRDVAGSLHGTLRGGAVIADGRLRLNGRDGYLETAPLVRPLREKTLEAWATPVSLSHRGGGIMTVEVTTGNTFDAVVFGEREPGKWVAGSEFYHRTRDLVAPAETAKVDELIHVAISYGANNRVTIYRNGQRYGESYLPDGDASTLRTYSAGDSHILIGLRHTGGNGYFAGEIAEARLYDRALSAEAVAASFRAGPDGVSPEAIVRALSPEQRREHARLSEELARLRAAHSAKSTPPPRTYAATLGKVVPTFVLRRGDVEKRGEQVRVAGLSSVRTPPSDLSLHADATEGEKRLKLADWIASSDNPLTARVMVNRIWHYHFGRGMVATPSDFGFNGERPSHAELLDWLASEFVAKGWSVKALHKLILQSATYQQGPTYDGTAAARDGDCRLLWRFPARRLEGETVRDAMLAVSGKLNPAVGGPSFRPFTVKVFGSNFYTLTDRAEPEFNRRTVYRISVCSAKDPLLEAFDCPDPSIKTPRRGSTTTPLQALGLMNNAFVQRQAKNFAARVSTEAGSEASAQVKRAYRLALARTPTADEETRATALVRENGLENLCWVLLNSSEFLNVR
jgi:hypothetical protein